VEHLTFGADEVTRKDLGVREWMLPPKPVSATQPLPKIKCRITHKDQKHVLTMPRESTVRDLLLRVNALFGDDKSAIGTEKGTPVNEDSRGMELRDDEGYTLMLDDLLGDLADQDKNTLVVNSVQV
jgi:hypothetical protein